VVIFCFDGRETVAPRAVTWSVCVTTGVSLCCSVRVVSRDSCELQCNGMSYSAGVIRVGIGGNSSGRPVVGNRPHSTALHSLRCPSAAARSSAAAARHHPCGWSHTLARNRSGQHEDSTRRAPHSPDASKRSDGAHPDRRAAGVSSTLQPSDGAQWR